MIIDSTNRSVFQKINNTANLTGKSGDVSLQTDVFSPLAASSSDDAAAQMKLARLKFGGSVAGIVMDMERVGLQKDWEVPFKNSREFDNFIDPVYRNDGIYVIAECALQKIDKNGAVEWKTELDESVFNGCAPAFDTAGNAYLTSCDSLYSVDPSGNILWKAGAPSDDRSFSGNVFVTGDKVFVLQTGMVPTLASYSTDGKPGFSITLDGPGNFFSTSDKDGKLHATMVLDRKNFGDISIDLNKQAASGIPDIQTRTGWDSHPGFFENGKYIYGLRDGQFCLFDNSGKRILQMDPAKENIKGNFDIQIDENCNVFFTDGKVENNEKQKITSFDSRGNKRWEFTPGESIPDNVKIGYAGISPLGNGDCYALLPEYDPVSDRVSKYHIYHLEPDGKVKWEMETAGLVQDYGVDEKGNLLTQENYAFKEYNGEDGKLIYKTPKHDNIDSVYRNTENDIFVGVDGEKLVKYHFYDAKEVIEIGKKQAEKAGETDDASEKITPGKNNADVGGVKLSKRKKSFKLIS